MTKTQFINELKAVLNTEDVIYMHHNQATVKNAQIVEVAVNGNPIVFTIDTTEWINNPGVKFTYDDIIEKLKDNNMNVVKYGTQELLVKGSLSTTVETKEDINITDLILIGLHNNLIGVDGITVNDMDVLEIRVNDESVTPSVLTRIVKQVAKPYTNGFAGKTELGNGITTYAFFL